MNFFLYFEPWRRTLARWDSPWSSLVEGDEGLYLSNCQSNFVIVLRWTVSIVLYFYKHNSSGQIRASH